MVAGFFIVEPAEIPHGGVRPLIAFLIGTVGNLQIFIGPSADRYSVFVKVRASSYGFSHRFIVMTGLHLGRPRA